MMQVLFDVSGTLFYSGGINTYTHQLAAARDTFTIYGINFQPINLPPPLHPPPKRTLRRKFSVLAWETYYMQGLVPRRARLQKMDLIHAPGIRFPLTTHIPVVVTIHDVIPILYPQLFPRHGAIILAIYFRLMRRFARIVIVNSQATKCDVEKHLHIPPERIAVTPLGVSPIFQPQSKATIVDARKRLGIQWPYLLCVGNIEPRKNLLRLIEAVALLHQRGWVYHLVVVGKGGPLSEPIYRKSMESGIKDFVHFTGFINDTDLAALYTGADAFIYPSLYEGFGLPIIEALACGCPVVTSNVSSMPEVGGDAALYINPYNTTDIANKIEQVLTSPTLADKLRHRGILHAKQFTWERCIELTAQAYYRALDS